jgi:predicted transcriptional regulator of viral defense system
MVQSKSTNLTSYIAGLMASGRLVFSRAEAQAAIGIGQGAFLDAAEKLKKRGQLITPRRGFYVVVPPQYLNLGSPPPASFIDDLMRRERTAYYVGLLKAAELHGAAHQAVMEFQVVATKQMAPAKAGRIRLAFFYRKDLKDVAAGIQEHKTDTGTMKISSPELTLFDLFRYPQASGGIDNIATVIFELGPKLDADKMAAIAPAFERAVVQRAGYILGKSGFDDLAKKLQAGLSRDPAVQWTELDRSLVADPELAPEIVERDKRWRVIVRHPPERDA